jgi:Cu(I)/Ag(I) efflux system membrane protein CusA/SilA
VIGGVVTSFLLELIVYPAIYKVWRGRELRKSFTEKPPAA